MNDHDTTGHYDAIVVGARVAGATTAMLLARAGRRVLVIERGAYGADTLSTHALMRGGVMQLSRFGLLDDVIAAGTPAVRRTVIRYGESEEIVDIKPSPHVDALYAPRRTVLDRVLIDAAAAAGASFRFECTVHSLLRDEHGRVTGVVARTRDGSTFTAMAPITIGADGIRSRVAREVGALTYVRGSHATAMVMGYWSDIEVDGYQWLYAPGRTAGLIPTNDGRVCAWMGLPPARFLASARHRADLGFREVFEAVAPDWYEVLASARRHGPLRGFPGVPGFLRQPWGRGWALVGDASHFKDPLTTHGMTDALRDAELLARAILATDGAPEDLAHELAVYQDTRDRLSRRLLEAADRAAAFRWELPELRELLLEISAAMRPEIRHLLDLDALPGAGQRPHAPVSGSGTV
jgi:flavin-dependent dehydrogenase